MHIRRGFDLLHGIVAITYPFWTVVLWIDIRVRMLVGIFLILEPNSHQLKTAMEHAIIYGMLFTFLGVYEPTPTTLRRGGLFAATPCGVSARNRPF